MKPRWFAAATLLGALTGTSPAGAEVYQVDRIVAVVGKTPILLSTLRRRARPFLTTMKQQVTDETQRLIGESKLYRQVLERLVDEQLIGRQAAMAELEVQPVDVEKALDNVAQQNGLSRKALMKEVERSGMTASSYREEISRQILEGKLLMQRLSSSPFMITDEQLRTLYDQQKAQDPDSVPSFEEARPQLTQQVRLKWFEAEKQRMVAQLRSETHIEVRLGP
jgi:peptidyl-prolyl cis-trans isomerase SurA